jgi:hypothetical protein
MIETLRVLKHCRVATLPHIRNDAGSRAVDGFIFRRLKGKYRHQFGLKVLVGGIELAYDNGHGSIFHEAMPWQRHQ